MVLFAEILERRGRRHKRRIGHLYRRLYFQGNADVVNLALLCAPVCPCRGLVVDPDMICVDYLRAYGTPNYYVQKLCSINKGTHIVSRVLITPAALGIVCHF